MSDPTPPPTEEQLRNQFLERGASFFNWNSGTNTGNVLIQLSKRLESLEKALIDSSASQDRGAAALVSLTRVYVWLTAVIALATIVQVVLALRHC